MQKRLIYPEQSCANCSYFFTEINLMRKGSMGGFLSFVMISAIVLGMIPAIIAKKKYRSFMLWWLFGTTLFIVALPTSILVSEGDPDDSGFGTKLAAAFSFIFIGVLFLGAVVAPNDNGLTIASSQEVVNYDKYKRIENGMSYQQVVAIIASPGEELSRNRIEGIRGVMPSTETVIYSWDNPDFSSMNVTFQNDKVFQKAQFGLQ